MNPLLIFSKDNLQAEPRGALTHSFTRGRVTTAPVLSCQLSSLPLLCKYCLRLQPSRREETVSFRVSSPLTYADEGEDKCTAVKSLFSICLQPVIRISISLLEDLAGCQVCLEAHRLGLRPLDEVRQQCDGCHRLVGVFQVRRCSLVVGSRPSSLTAVSASDRNQGRKECWNLQDTTAWKMFIIAATPMVNISFFFLSRFGYFFCPSFAISTFCVIAACD